MYVNIVANVKCCRKVHLSLKGKLFWLRISVLDVLHKICPDKHICANSSLLTSITEGCHKHLSAKVHIAIPTEAQFPACKPSYANVLNSVNPDHNNN